MKSFKSLCVLLAMMFLIMSCASMQTQQLTTKQQSAIWFNVYNSVYDDTMAMSVNPAITPIQKEIVAKKKAILTQLWPLLKLYAGVVDSGGAPSVETTNQITNLINLLVMEVK